MRALHHTLLVATFVIVGCGGSETPATEVTDVTPSAAPAASTVASAPSPASSPVASATPAASATEELTYAGWVDGFCACEGDMDCGGAVSLKFKEVIDAGKPVPLDQAMKLADCLRAHPLKPK